MFSFIRVFSSFAVVDGLWHHFYFWWNSTSTWWHFYIDGVLSKSEKFRKAGPMIPGNSTLVLGQSQVTSESEFVDNVSFCGEISQFIMFKAGVGQNIKSWNFIFGMNTNKRISPLVMWIDVKLWASTGVQEIAPSSNTYLGNFTLLLLSVLLSFISTMINNKAKWKKTSNI